MAAAERAAEEPDQDRDAQQRRGQNGKPDRIDPDGIHTPGIFVKRMVHVPNPVKHIEQRTTRKRAEAAPAGAGEEV